MSQRGDRKNGRDFAIDSAAQDDPEARAHLGRWGQSPESDYTASLSDGLKFVADAGEIECPLYPELYLSTMLEETVD